MEAVLDRDMLLPLIVELDAVKELTVDDVPPPGEL
jgi:hypothetical protein